MTIKAGSKVTYHRENFEMAVKFKFLEIERLGIKDYPPFSHMENGFLQKYEIFHTLKGPFFAI